MLKEQPPPVNAGGFLYNNNMNNKIKPLFIVASLAVGGLCACGNLTDKLVGADRDEHGCIGSAGYVWSRVRQACVRPWEEGLALVDVQEGPVQMNAQAILSNDFNQVEIFIPRVDAPVLLTRTADTWQAAGQPWRLVRHPAQAMQQELWELFENDVLRFKANALLLHPLYEASTDAN